MKTVRTITPNPNCKTTMQPKVVIVGRPNVGKSSLLNMLAGRKVSIVDPTPGVTRDRVSVEVNLLGSLEDDKSPSHKIELIDTGGHGIKDSQDLTLDVEKQIAKGVGSADLILFVIDAQTGIVPLDEDVARLLRTAGCVAMDQWKLPPDVTDPTKKPKRRATPVLLIANKVDGDSHEPGALEANSLGFGDPIMISAVNRYNRNRFNGKLHSSIRKIMPAVTQRYAGMNDAEHQSLQTGVQLAIVGKRNAGKSTLVNALAGEERVIVSEIEGTTRDSVDVKFEIKTSEGLKTFTAIDTAGVRKRKSLDGDIEYYSYHRALRSIRRADVVLFLIDSSLPVSQVDKQLSLEMQKHFKPCVLVINKWDLAEKKHTQEEYIEYLDGVMQGLSFAPVVFISAKKGEGMREVVGMAMNLYEQAGHRVTTGELNRLFERILENHSPRSKLGKRPKIFYVTQTDVHPPSISVFVNNPDMFDPSYQRYLINQLREELPYSEVPIKLSFRGKKSFDKLETT